MPQPARFPSSLSGSRSSLSPAEFRSDHDFYKKLKNAICEYDRWVDETQRCKLRDTSDTLIGRACAMFHCNMVFVNYIDDMVVDTQFHKF